MGCAESNGPEPNPCDNPAAKKAAYRTAASGREASSWRWTAEGATVMTTYFEVGVLLPSATLSIGTRTFVSGK